MEYRPKFTITDKIRANLREIEKLKDQVSWERILPEAEAAIRLRASVESVHSSTSIEGNPLSVNEVRKVITSDDRFLGNEKTNEDGNTSGKSLVRKKSVESEMINLTREEYAEIEVKNYKKALDYIDARRRGKEELELQDILELHRIITTGLLDETRNGKIRRNMVYIENQRHEVLYTAVEAERVLGELEALLDWVREERFLVHPVVMAGVLHYQLATIHPFADGNGRTARATTGLFLALRRYDCNGALVLDSYYATERRAYYDALANVQRGDFWTAREADLTPWLEYFTDGFLSSMHVLMAEIRIVKMATSEVNGGLGADGSDLVGMGADGSSAHGSGADDSGENNSDVANSSVTSLSQAEQEILSLTEKAGSVSISELEATLPEMNRRTIQRKLRRLVELGYLQMVGEGRESRYKK